VLSASAIDALLSLARFEADVGALRAQMLGVLPSGEARQSILGILDELQALAEAPDPSRAVLARTSVVPFMRRGLGYYSGFVFELHAPLAISSNSHTRICGGGRYGDLYDWIYQRARQTLSLRSPGATGAPARPGMEHASPGQSLTSVGFAFGLDRLAAWMGARGPGEPVPEGLRVVPGAPEDAGSAYDLATALRARCSRVRLCPPTELSSATGRARVCDAARVVGERFVVLASGGRLELLDLETKQSDPGASTPRVLSHAELLRAVEGNDGEGVRR
jgi:histidyl-tRNA synthetase